MNFRAKCLLQQLFSVVPAGADLNYLCQRYVTRTLPLSGPGFRSRLESTRRFYQLYLRHSAMAPSDSTCLDFSAGTHLQNPIGLSLLGFREIYTADVVRMARPSLIEDVVRRYARAAGVTGHRPVPVPFRITRRDMVAVLAQRLRITYLAPVVISRLSLPDASLDFIVSRTTLEHVPADEIPLIARRCRQLLRAGGIAVLSIDYRDHWSLFDPAISAYNFLRYSARQWERWNPRMHYQNRLRHLDYRRMLNEAGFAILEEEQLQPTEQERAQLDAVPLDETIRRKYGHDDLLALRGLFVVRK